MTAYNVLLPDQSLPIHSCKVVINTRSILDNLSFTRLPSMQMPSMRTKKTFLDDLERKLSLIMVT